MAEAGVYIVPNSPQGNIDGEENARLGGKKFKAGRKNLREKKRGREGEKIKEKSFKQ